MSLLSAPHFHNERAAYAYVEARLWPNGPVCPHCGGVERISAMKGKSTRIGAYKCYQCRKPFTVKIGTVFEASHIPMRQWLQVIFLMASSKKGISANQIHRSLGCTLKTAWFLCHRVREAMAGGALAPFGGGGGAVEIDETFIGWDDDSFAPRGTIASKMKVMSLVDRTTGQARSFVMKELSIKAIAPILEAHVSREAHIMTDEAKTYAGIGWNFAAHGHVNHGRGEYVSKVDPNVHTNTVEGFYSVFKRGMRGIYQHCSNQHLHRYVAEFDFRYSNRIALGIDDATRADHLLQGVVGKRLTYRTTAGQA